MLNATGEGCYIPLDKKVAAEVDGIHVIVGGHSHTFLYTGTVHNV